MNRLNGILKDPKYIEFLSKNERAEISTIYCKHTFEHMLDVARITYILMQEDNVLSGLIQEACCVDKTILKELIYTAGLLHDIGKWEQYITGESHAISSARYAVDLMTRYNFETHEVKIVTNAVKEHRNSCIAFTLLGKYLQRADKISRLCFKCLAQESCNKLGTMVTVDKLLL